MKCCHHGAADVTDEFIRAVNPLAYVVSSGDEESHAHPRPDLLGRLGKLGRGDAPLILCTEILRSTREKGREEDFKSSEPLDDQIDDPADRHRKNIALQEDAPRAAGPHREAQRRRLRRDHVTQRRRAHGALVPARSAARKSSSGRCMRCTTTPRTAGFLRRPGIERAIHARL